MWTQYQPCFCSQCRGVYCVQSSVFHKKHLGIEYFLPLCENIGIGMSFLRLRDYFTEIKEQDLVVILKQLDQTTSFTPTKVREENEENTIEIVEAMIRHRYDVRKIFKPIIPFTLAETFQINDLTEYSEPAYDATITYTSGDRRSFSQTTNNVLLDDIFAANIDIGTPEAFNPSKWDKVTENFSLYFALQPTTGNLPDTAFAFSENNFTGNHELIQGWDKTRTIFLKRVESTIKIYYSSTERDNDTNSIGIASFNPDELDNNNLHNHGHNHPHHRQNHISGHRGPRFDPSIKEFPTNIPIQFGNDAENSLSGDLSIIGFIPKDTTWDVEPSNFFTKGDNRSRLMKKIVVNLALFELHALISPRNIPDLRGERKDDSMKLLGKIESGKITPDLPIFFDEEQGQSVTFSSNRKLRHQY